MSERRILIIGGGPAGTFAALAAKKRDPGASIVLLTREHCEPYEKPPLSKAVLLGAAEPDAAPIAGPAGVRSHDVALEVRADCAAIDRGNRSVVLTDGRRLRYDALVIATGSVPRELPFLPNGTPSVHYLRSEADARALKSALRASRRLLVVGGGLIGLEVAASAAMLGLAVPGMSGVDIRVDRSLSSVHGPADGGIAVATAGGDQIVADLAVVGTGSIPETALASAAGLATDDGVVVDAQCRTSDPAIFAAGDCVRFPGPAGLVRLENWIHAQDQGTVAGRNAAGASDAYAAVPSFWSEQYDLYIQGVGWPASAGTRVRRPLDGNRLLVFDVKEGRMIHAMGINVQRDIAMARRLIERGAMVDPIALADPAQPLAQMLKR